MNQSITQIYTHAKESSLAVGWGILKLPVLFSRELKCGAVMFCDVLCCAVMSMLCFAVMSVLCFAVLSTLCCIARFFESQVQYIHTYICAYSFRFIFSTLISLFPQKLFLPSFLSFFFTRITVRPRLFLDRAVQRRRQPETHSLGVKLHRPRPNTHRATQSASGVCHWIQRAPRGGAAQPC